MENGNSQRAKNDKFCAQYEIIESELKYYKKHFEGKIVYCNCDDPRESNFFKYFVDNFHELKLKKLIASCYVDQSYDLFSMGKEKKPAVWTEYDGKLIDGRVPSVSEIEIKELKGDGNFRSKESIELLKQSDIVVTNPPSSLFEEFISQMMKYDKKFLILGTMNDIIYKEIFPYIKENKLWPGVLFNSSWTNIDYEKEDEIINIDETYNKTREEFIMNTKKRALLFKHKKNYLDIELEKAFAHGLGIAGFEVDIIDIDQLAEMIDNFNVEKYDMIAFDVQYNSLFSAGKKRAYMFERLFERAKEGSLTMYACDIKLPLQPGLWDKGESSRQHKRNVFNSRPVKVLASLDPSITNDKEAYERINTLWMNKLHEDSTVHFVEWITFAIHTYGKNIGNHEDYEGEKIRNFYYGMKRSFIGASLIKNGVEDERDLLYGSIGKSVNIDSVRKVDVKVKEPFSWIKFIKHSDNVIFPYEPLKSDYQITLRLLEALMFYGDKVVFDDRVNKDIVKLAKDKQLWVDKAKESVDRISRLY